MTLKESDRQREAQREWIRERDRLVEAVATARTRLKQLEATLKRPDDASAALESILALSEAVPDGIHTHGNGLGVPGGFNVRDTLREVASNALIDVSTKRKRLEADLPQAQRKLAEIESALERHAGQKAVHAGDVRAKLPDFVARGTGDVR
jgi:hypothetical protein